MTGHLAPQLRLRGALISLALGLSVGLAVVAAAEQPLDSCIKYWGEVRFGGVGYNHLVHMVNSCSRTADCLVSTDVNPSAQMVEVPADSEVIVNTVLDSPSRRFTPHVTCTMRN
jgi:hypothetical protein